MTLEQSSKSEITAKSGSKISTKRTVKTFIPKSTVTSTPWGVSLKPVPRKKVVEEITKTESKTVNPTSAKTYIPPKPESKVKTKPKVRKEI